MQKDEIEQRPIRIRYIEDLAEFGILDERPELIGGFKTLADKVKYPECKAQIEGRVIVQFTVDEEGNARDTVILEGIGGRCDEEAIRVITEHAKFKPGISQGNAVPVRISMRVGFNQRQGRLLF